MLSLRPLIAGLLCCLVPLTTTAAELQGGYSVTYSGGSLPNVKSGEGLRLFVDSDRIRLSHKGQELIVIRPRAITEVSYGQEVHRRIGTAAALAVVSLGIGAIVAFSKSKKHYIGFMWAEGDTKGGIVLQADKNEYRGMIAALEGVTGRTAVDTDSPRTAVQTNTPRTRQETIVSATPPPENEAPKPILVRFTSVPTEAEVRIDGEYWGSTPTADLTRLAAGSHTIVVKRLGYQLWERKITLAPGDERVIKAELEVQPYDPTKPRISGN